METKIDYRFKIMYAIGMIVIVAGHCWNGGISLFYEWFPPYAFHLPLFAFVSGYFYKNKAEENCGKYIWKKVKRLIIPLYLWNFFYAVVVAFLSMHGFTMGTDITLENLLIAPITNGHQFYYNVGGWFVIPLFMIEVYNVLIRKMFCILHIKANEWCYFVIHTILGIFGVYLASCGFHDGWWLVLVRMLFFLPFYSIGTLYKEKLEKYDKKISGFWYFTAIFAVELVILCVYGKIPYYTPAWCNDFSSIPLMPFVVGILGIAFWLRVSKVLEPAIGKSKYVNFIADNTYSIMIHQFIGFMMVKTLFAFVSKFTPLFSDFDWVSYKTDIWYYYVPNGNLQFVILYLVAGITIPIAIACCMKKLAKVWRIICENIINRRR